MVSSFVCNLVYKNRNGYSVVYDFFMICLFVSSQRVPLDSSCWLPAFTVKLRDSSKCVCPMRSYGAVTVVCTESDAFDVVHASSGSATHHLGDALSESPGPLEYDDVSFLTPLEFDFNFCIQINIEKSDRVANGLIIPSPLCFHVCTEFCVLSCEVPRCLGLKAPPRTSKEQKIGCNDRSI